MAIIRAAGIAYKVSNVITGPIHHYIRLIVSGHNLFSVIGDIIVDIRKPMGFEKFGHCNPYPYPLVPIPTTHVGYPYPCPSLLT